jgi:uncharacterized protein YjbI with pentapeptide repeats
MISLTPTLKLTQFISIIRGASLIMNKHHQAIILRISVIISAVLVLLTAACMPSQNVSQTVEPAQIAGNTVPSRTLTATVEGEAKITPKVSNSKPVVTETAKETTEPTQAATSLPALTPSPTPTPAPTNLSSLTQKDIQEAIDEDKKEFSRRRITGTLESLNLMDVDFNHADFSGVTLKDMTWTNIDLTGATFTNTVIISVTFRNVTLTNASFVSSTLTNTVMTAVKLNGSNFRNVTGLLNRHLESAADKDLSGITLAGQDLTGIDLSGFNLSGAKLISSTILNKSNFAEAWLVDAKLISVTLKQSNFTQAFLYGSNFTKANLIQANFTGANIGCHSLVPTDIGSAKAKKGVIAALNQVAEAKEAAMQAIQSTKDTPKGKVEKAKFQAVLARTKLAEALLFLAKVDGKDAVFSEGIQKPEDGFKNVSEAQGFAIQAAKNAGMTPPFFALLGLLDEFDFELICQQHGDSREEQPTRRTNFAYANLTDAIFYNADVRHVDFTHALMINTKFNTPGYAVTARNALTTTAPNAANAQGADFSWADLTNACLSGADLTGANLQSTLMGNVELNGTKLQGANLSQAYVSPYAIETATCDEKTTLPFNFDAISAYTCIQNSKEPQ